jgi:hypothetical protein
MTGKSWPQVMLGVLILFIGLLAIRHGLAGGEVRWHSYYGAGGGSPLPFGPEIIVLIGLVFSIFGVYVIAQVFRL